MHVLNLATDYAIRSMVYLAEKNAYASTKEISKAMSVPTSYSAQVMRKLKLAGLVKTQMGNAGGYALAKESKDVSLYDIIDAIEGYICLNRCMEKDHFCSRGMSDTCQIHQFYRKIQTDVEQYFMDITLHKIVSGNLLFEEEKQAV